MRKSTSILNAIRLLASFLFISLLAACGGGDGGGSSGDSGSGASTQLSGVAATGAAMANATITVYDMKGKTLTATADANGSYTIANVSGMAAPLLVVATNGTNTLTALVSKIADGKITGNINQLTDRIASDVSGVGTQALIELFKVGTTSSITVAKITEKTATVRSEILAALTAAGISNPETFDPVSFTMQVGDAYDKVLDQVSFRYDASGKIIIATPAPCTLSSNDGSSLDSSKLTWCAVAFGQSTDLNFATNLTADQVGINNVWFDGKKLGNGDASSLNGAITVESRGGKIANTHDGLTFYYTRLSTGVNFKLEADVTVEKFGPSLSTPNAQEGAGLMVRDVNGSARLEPMKDGYEEFPAASNMVMNAIMTKNKKSDGELAIQTIYRDGVNYAWGNTGAIIPKATYATTNFNTTPNFKLKLERTDSGFVATYAKEDGSGEVSQTVSGANANIVQTIDSKYMYVGFFAARNARVTFKNAKLSLTKANTVNAPKYVATVASPVLEVASPSVVASNSYLLQARTNYDGKITVTQDGNVIASNATVSAGQHYASTLTISGASSSIKLDYTPTDGPSTATVSKTLTVTKKEFADPANLYASPSGTSSGAGTPASPLDVATAANYVAPGGTVHLLDGTYSTALTLQLTASGGEGKLKKLVVDNKGSVIFTRVVTLDASYWHIKGIEIAGVTSGNGMRISGSNNIVEEVVVHNSSDTGMQMTAKTAANGRALWPANNLILNSESYDNADSAMKNADGFAAKLGVGDGNVFRGCISHHNVDDGWDLFNKIEDGANGIITIENSIAYSNGKPLTLPAGVTAMPEVGSIGNGFKLGAEGYPVAHIVRNNIAFDNNMDGFTDNFNPGALAISNNVVLNSARFNYIFRPGPYTTTDKQGKFTSNVSLRTSAGKYSDAVTGVVDASNYFYNLGSDKSVSSNGTTISTSDYASITPPLVNNRFQRNADGSIILNGFLQKK
ncbi:MAG: right-handed parallel beta-helix repeat-containing protein [Proteobacteria bacterium]|nr:right-handed parallel beta-helix repeat-containing protein [Pseudomonadota bacterium]